MHVCGCVRMLYVYTHVCARMCVCMGGGVCVGKCTCLYAPMCSGAYVYLCTCVEWCARLYAPMCPGTYVYVDTYMWKSIHLVFEAGPLPWNQELIFWAWLADQ